MNTFPLLFNTYTWSLPTQWYFITAPREIYVTLDHSSTFRSQNKQSSALFFRLFVWKNCVKMTSDKEMLILVSHRMNLHRVYTCYPASPKWFDNGSFLGIISLITATRDPLPSREITLTRAQIIPHWVMRNIGPKWLSRILSCLEEEEKQILLSKTHSTSYDGIFTTHHFFSLHIRENSLFVTF